MRALTLFLTFVVLAYELAPVAAAPAYGARGLEPTRAMIAQARSQAPESFERVNALVASTLANPPPIDRRGQVERKMKALGPDALLPLLALIIDTPALATAPAWARELVQVSAIEAVGALRDHRARPVMYKILDDATANERVARAAAEALGQLDDPDELAYLVARGTSGDRRERAALFGIGYVRRPAAAAALQARLVARPDADTTEVIAAAMGWLGSSWAWAAFGPARADEGLALRGELAGALVAALPGYRGRARTAIADALVMIDHPSTARRIEALRARSDRALAVELQALSDRLASSR
jgi:HEAT repeat protein